jgi:HK97 family phage prohead protease
MPIMTWWRRFGAWFRAGARPRHGFSESAPMPIDQLISAMMGMSGNQVSKSAALSVPAVQRGRNMICSIATLPLAQVNQKNEPVRNPLFDQLDPDVPNVVTLAQTIEDLLFEGIAWWQVIEFSGEADPNARWPVKVQRRDPATVSLEPPGNGRNPAPLPSNVDPRGGVVWMDGKPVPFREVIRFDSPNPGLLKVAGKAIRRAILLNEAALMYANDPRPLDYFTPAEGADEIGDEEVETILARWQAARKKRSTAWVPRAMKYNAVDAPTPQQLQLVELQKQTTLELANALGLDPEDLGLSTTSRTYQNAVDRRQDRINDTYSPYMRALTDRLSMNDITRRGNRVVLDLDDYLKANPTDRWTNYSTAFALVDEEGKRAMSVDEIRAEEDMTPAPKPPKPKPAPVPTPLPDPDTVDVPNDASALAGYEFSEEDGPRAFTLDLPLQSFSVNRTTRTIEGLALPYGVVGQKYGIKFRFLNGSLKWKAGAVDRIKLLVNHDPGQAVGYATKLSHTAAGLVARFKVARGAEGDRALSLAEDKVLDGMSAGVDFDLVEDALLNESDGVWDVHRAYLRETSLTPMPVFDDARVTKVAASRNGPEGTDMDECTTCGQRHAPGACPTPAPQPTNQPPAQPAGVTLSNEQVTALLARPGALQALMTPAASTQPAPPPGGLTFTQEQVDAIIKAGGLPVLLGMPGAAIPLTPRQDAPEQREQVNPTRQTASTFVREELPYRFDAQGSLGRGQYDLSTDLYNWSTGDGEAGGRANKFVKAVAHMFLPGGTYYSPQARAQFDVATGDVTALNPPIQRPDMYVDQKDFQYNVWMAINKGVLNEVTPFVVPKFATAAGLVGDHTQGVEPTSGTYTATSQTITPTPLSGKMSITREAWDQGGNPQLSGIIWRQMTKSWFEGLETAAIAHLDSLTPTQIVLTTAAQDDALVGELETAFASLQFIRGGFRMDDLFLQVDLYKALAAATDADGRKLLPRLGPVNATGTSSDRFADLDIAGVRGRPEWALAASGLVPASSYLFDRMDVNGWASPPQRLNFETQVKSVEIAIWGYKALATTDLTGVREIVYDPAI